MTRCSCKSLVPEFAIEMQRCVSACLYLKVLEASTHGVICTVGLGAHLKLAVQLSRLRACPHTIMSSGSNKSTEVWAPQSEGIAV